MIPGLVYNILGTPNHEQFILTFFGRFISNWLKTITNIIPLAEDGEGVIGNPSIMGPLIAVLSMIG